MYVAKFEGCQQVQLFQSKGYLGISSEGPLNSEAVKLLNYIENSLAVIKVIRCSNIRQSSPKAFKVLKKFQGGRTPPTFQRVPRASN